MDEIITSSSNSQIKHVKSLQKKKDRWEKRNFLLEGVRATEESLKSKSDIEYILITEEMLFNVKGGREIYDTIKREGYRYYHISQKLFRDIADTENPQGIIAVMKFDIKKLNEVLIDKGNFLIILDRVQDPGNMGTIIRTADALGVNGVIITEGCVDVYNPKTIRSTMGSILHMPLVYYDRVSDAIRELKERNIKIMSTDLESSEFCHKVNFTQDFALIIGNEASGISKDILSLSDNIIKIPMPGKAESFNAAIASAIIMYEATRQRLNI